jgi:hypothetical protein
MPESSLEYGFVFRNIPVCIIIYGGNLYRRLWQNPGTIPKDWKHANFAPAFKKGERYKAENYRPISLTCICCKLMEHIINIPVCIIIYGGKLYRRLWQNP